MAGLQQLDHLVEGARLRHVVEQAGELLDRRARLRLDLEAELGGEADGTDDPHRILAVALRRVADHPQQLLLHVLDAAVIVDHDLAQGVVVHRVDGEVAPLGILDLRPPDVVAQHPALGVDDVALAGELAPRGLLVAADQLGRGGVRAGAEGRDLDHLREPPLLAAAAEDDMDDAKAPADDEGAAEQALHLLRRGVGRDVEVLGAQAHEQVAHRAADDVGLVAALGQRRDDLDGALVDQRRVDAVHVLRHLDALAARAPPACPEPDLPSSLSMNFLIIGRRVSRCASPVRAPPPRARATDWRPPGRWPARAGAGRWANRCRR